MKRNTFHHSLRLGFAGAWLYTHPLLSRQLEYLQGVCPELANSFILSNESGLSDADSDHNALGETRGFGTAGAFLDIARSLGIAVPDKQLSVANDLSFTKQLRQAYGEFYGIHNIRYLEMSALKSYANISIPNK